MTFEFLLVFFVLSPDLNFLDLAIKLMVSSNYNEGENMLSYIFVLIKSEKTCEMCTH